jgi:hypothetical protein
MPRTPGSSSKRTPRRRAVSSRRKREPQSLRTGRPMRAMGLAAMALGAVWLFLFLRSRYSIGLAPAAVSGDGWTPSDAAEDPSTSADALAMKRYHFSDSARHAH